ncbi:Peptide-methionine s-oxide reductase, partial [Globisporangium splendens]
MGIENQTETSVAYFAAGCFWGVELAFQRVPGVLHTTVGYAQGHQENATYKQVCSGKTGHAETIKIEFDASEVTYEQLLDKFWSIHDPTTLNRQKEDVGTQYRSGIYYLSEEQKTQATASKEAQQQKIENPIVTEIEEFRVFWPAEEYHQQYLEKGGQCADKGSDVPIKCYG